jgi:lipoprotein-anchoring transpeptidase ErfK/SrfK
MRKLTAGAAAVSLVGAVFAAAGTLAWAGVRHSRLEAAAARLQQQWKQDEQQGVTASALSPVSDGLAAVERRESNWWQHPWSVAGDADTVDSLSRQTGRIRDQQLAQERDRAAGLLAQWDDLRVKQSAWIPPSLRDLGSGWPAELEAASTPGQLRALADRWAGEVSQASVAAQTARSAAQAELAAFSGPDALLGRAQTLLQTATADSLDDGGAGALASEVRTAIAAGLHPDTQESKLATMLQSLQALIDENNAVAQGLASLPASVLQAQAEGTPGAGAEASAMQAARTAFVAARTHAQMDTAQAQVTALATTVQQDLDNNRCGHPVPAGKVITMSLSLQEMIFYQDGCAVRATAITTGRPALPTPTGSFHVFNKQSPYVMRSPWPPGSPYWYPTTNVQWVMEFASGGYFIHDAYWESASQYGPGGQYTAGASHGCVHVPTSTMRWAYDWTPMGTPVIVTG